MFQGSVHERGSGTLKHECGQSNEHKGLEATSNNSSTPQASSPRFAKQVNST